MHQLLERPHTGEVLWDWGTRTHVVVLAAARHRVEEDGRSFGLDREEGWLHSATVRAALDAEVADGPCPCRAAAQVRPKAQ